ncbi:major royal jelly protein 1 [Episyrphus balteatus]|uniref:major royal jelly protein 1 n=1 Tax=Episyrphus balteatus TaxID=286459 RepID=UPI00248602C1|nr:major royal jelly protein 1 [Episyrphus balteatus]
MASQLETLVYLLLMVLNLVNGILDTSPLETITQWKLISYNFPPKSPTTDQSFYSPENILITGLAIGYDRIYVATPQLFSGVTATVSSIPKVGAGDNPVLEVFPDWSYAVAGRKDFNCSDLKLISVYRMRIDSCNRLWALDAGISRSLEDYEVTCPPKILVFDLATNRVVRRIDFPRQVLRGESLFTNLIIDETTSKAGTCDDVFVYISDTVEPAIVVYDSQQDVTWRVSHPSMYPDPDFAQSEILGDRFVLMDGVVGLTFDEKAGIAYYQPLATDRVFSITREVLRSGPIALTQLLPVKLVGKKSSQGITLGVSPIDGSLLFSPLSETAIASWNPTTGRQQTLATDQQRLQFVADLTTPRIENGALYMVSSKFHRFFLKNLNRNEYNNRILRIDLTGSTPSSLSPFIPTKPSTNYAFYSTNSIEKRPSVSSFVSNTAVTGNFFSSPNLSPFGYELFPKSSRNPFTALNPDEALQTKLTRQPSESSFLDNLPPVGYTYKRFTRSIGAEKNAMIN